jgi:hypothetical protein
MFLPAKFDSNDNLQRLGLAYMTKGGGPIIPTKPSIATPAPAAMGVKDDGKKKRRRQSAPAQAGFKGVASRAAASDGRKKRISLGLTKVAEGEGEVEAE